MHKLTRYKPLYLSESIKYVANIPKEIYDDVLSSVRGYTEEDYLSDQDSESPYIADNILDNISETYYDEDIEEEISFDWDKITEFFWEELDRHITKNDFGTQQEIDENNIKARKDHTLKIRKEFNTYVDKELPKMWLSLEKYIEKKAKKIGAVITNYDSRTDKINKGVKMIKSSISSSHYIDFNLNIRGEFFRGLTIRLSDHKRYPKSGFPPQDIQYLFLSKASIEVDMVNNFGDINYDEIEEFGYEATLINIREDKFNKGIKTFISEEGDNINDIKKEIDKYFNHIS